MFSFSLNEKASPIVLYEVVSRIEGATWAKCLRKQGADESIYIYIYIYIYEEEKSRRREETA